MPTPAENYMDVPHWEPEPKPSDSPERLCRCPSRSLGTGQESNSSQRCLGAVGPQEEQSEKASRRGHQPYGKEHEESVGGMGNTGTEWPIEREGSQAYAVWLEWRAMLKAAEGGRTSDQ